MAGGYLFSELFFDEVRVPRSALLGELMRAGASRSPRSVHERAGVARLYLGLSTTFDELLQAARSPAHHEPLHRDRLARLYRRHCLHSAIPRLASCQIEQGGQPSATMGGLAKLSWARAAQEAGTGHEHPRSEA